MSEPDDGYPRVYCPRCRAEHVDMDGFGFIACLPKPPGCGYCTHPSADFDGTTWSCSLCGEAT